MGVDDHDTFSGLTALQAAAAAGDVSKCIELLDAGADMNIQANGEVRARVCALHHRGSSPRARRQRESRAISGDSPRRRRAARVLRDRANALFPTVSGFI
jgi:hypothetical protein